MGPGIVPCVRCRSHVASLRRARSSTVKSTSGGTLGFLGPLELGPRLPRRGSLQRYSGVSQDSATTAISKTESLPSVRKPYVLELFCGTAGVFAAMQKRGCDVLGVDHKLKPRSMKASAVRVDLRDPVQQDMVMREVARAEAVWVAPPSGAASQARSIPLPSGKSPVPLRSETYPCGLPDISGIDRERVQAANELYAFAARVFEFCAANRKVCRIENPTGSLMWLTPWMQKISNLGIFHRIQNCMYGGARDKRTALFSTHDLPSMHLLCDQSHKHAPWGKVRVNGGWQFSTSSESRSTRPLSVLPLQQTCAPSWSKVAGIWKASPYLIRHWQRRLCSDRQGAMRHAWYPLSSSPVCRSALT